MHSMDPMYSPSMEWHKIELIEYKENRKKNIEEIDREMIENRMIDEDQVR